jgi:hypothetical protein
MITREMIVNMASSSEVLTLTTPDSSGVRLEWWILSLVVAAGIILFIFVFMRKIEK